MQDRALFIGNSYTYQNDLPGFVKSIAHANEFPLFYDLEVGGGVTLEMHINSGRVVPKLRDVPWNFCVLQEQSTRPLESPKLFSHSVKTLSDIAHSKEGIKVILFCPWLERERWDQQQLLTEVYTQVAEETGTIVAPVGDLWESLQRKNFSYELYEEDGRHPSYIGSYIAACCVFCSLYEVRVDKVALSAKYLSLPEKDIYLLRESLVEIFQK